MLQADSEPECLAWMSAIQSAVSKAYRDTNEEREVIVISVFIMHYTINFYPLDTRY